MRDYVTNTISLSQHVDKFGQLLRSNIHIVRSQAFTHTVLHLLSKLILNLRHLRGNAFGRPLNVFFELSVVGL